MSHDWSPPTLGLTRQANMLYKKKIAIGCVYIRTETAFFRYRDETFEVPAAAVMGETSAYGSYYTIPLARIRKIAKEQKNG